MTITHTLYHLLLRLITPSRYKTVQSELYHLTHIASGATGYVFLAEQLATRKKYALKQVAIQTEEQRRSYNDEVRYLQHFANSDHIIQLFAHQESAEAPYGYIIMPYMKVNLGSRQKQELAIIC